jgi:hypothetical protein
MSKPPIKQKYIKEPSDLLDAWNNYKTFVDSNPDIQDVATGKGILQISVKKPYTRQGFLSYFYTTYGHHVKQYLDNEGGAYESYLEVVTHIRTEWEADQIEGSLTGRYKSPNLVARLNGLADKQETKHEITKFEFGND